MTNSFQRNDHPFNIGKYYKMNYHNIPWLSKYEVIIWIDGSIQITHANTSEWVYNKIVNEKYPVVTWMHEMRHGILALEVAPSMRIEKYAATHFFGHTQTHQRIVKQYQDYIRDGYNNSWWDQYRSTHGNNHTHFGVFLTCFVAFDNRLESVKNFTDFWFLQNLNYSTQDQVSFPYVVYKTGIVPYTLPDADIAGDTPHQGTMFYKKWNHGSRRR